MCLNNYLILLSMVIYFYLPASSHSSMGSELIELPCRTSEDCQNLIKELAYRTDCIQDTCHCFNKNNSRIMCSVTNSSKASVINVVGGPCVDNACSIENTFCDVKEQRCLCSQNYTISSDRRRCYIEFLKLNEFCEVDSQCFKHDQFSKCDALLKRCKCQENFMEHDNACWSKINLGATCVQDSDCQNRTHHAVCKEQHCVCHRGYVAKQDKTECLPDADYGESCFESTQCQKRLGVGSICENGICICDANHYNISMPDNAPIGNRFMCERRIFIGDTCMEHDQCYQFDIEHHEQSMICVNNECTCLENFQQIDKFCIKTVTGGADFTIISNQYKWLPFIIIILSIIKCI